MSVFHAASLVKQLARRLNLHRHLRQHEADRLKFTNRFAELFAFLRIIQSHLVGALGAAETHRADGETSAVESGKHDMRAVAGFSQNIIIGETHIVELQFTRVGGAPHHLAVHRTLREAESVVFDEKHSKFRLPAVFSRYDLNRASERHRSGTVGDKNFRAIDNPLIINLFCCRFRSSRVAAGSFFRQTEAPEMAFA